MSDTEQQTNQEEKKYLIPFTENDIKSLFKFLGRTELKGLEVPEMNKIFAIFDPKNLK
jgi:hypothetical protein